METRSQGSRGTGDLERPASRGLGSQSSPHAGALESPGVEVQPKGVPARKLSPDQVTFSFGRNWQHFVDEYLTPEREQTAIRSLTEFLGMPDLHERSFLDVGCGSGLFSLAALRLGARRVVSIDVDPFSVRCCEQLRNKYGSPDRWAVAQGSVLDKEFLARLDKADIVYAWGSLHHTGDMWQAIRNAANLVERNGLLYLSIYNKVNGRGGSEFWLKVKRLYNRLPKVGKLLLEVGYALRFDIFPQLIRLRNPFSSIRNYAQRRGMSYWTDVRDWLGGYPYEFATADEIFRFCASELRLALVNLRVTNTLGTNEFLFRRPASGASQ